MSTKLENSSRRINDTDDRFQFRASLVSATDLGIKSLRALTEMYDEGKIKTTRDLCSFSDLELLSVRNIGPRTLLRIREHFPYVPRTNG